MHCKGAEAVYSECTANALEERGGGPKAEGRWRTIVCHLHLGGAHAA